MPYVSSLAVAHYGSPYVSAYPWSAGFGTKYSDPGTLPANNGYGVAFSPSGAAIAISHPGSPYVTAYPWTSGTGGTNGGFGTKYSDPGTLPTGDGNGVAFSPSGAAIAIVHYGSPYVSAYPWSAGFGTKYSDPGTLPTGIGTGVAFSPSGTDIAIVHYGSPYVSAYPWSAGFGTKYSNPGTLPANNSYGVAFSPSGAAIAIAHPGSPYVTAYPWSAGFGTKYANPGTLPTSNSNGVAFSPSGTDIAIVHEQDPNVSSYPWSSGFGTKYANPGTLPPSYGYGVAFSSSGAAIAISHDGSPNVSSYPWSSGFGTKYADPGTLPTSYGYSVAFSNEFVPPVSGAHEYPRSVSTVATTSPYDDDDWANPNNIKVDDAAYADIQFVSTSAGPLSPTAASTALSAPYDDNDWNSGSASAITTDDTTYVGCTAATYDTNRFTYLLKAQGFGFTIPSNATILGVEAKIIKYCAAGTAIDGLVQLLNASGALFGSSLASASNWAGSMTESTYGGSTNMWGLNTSTLTPAIVNDADFGIALSAKATADNTDVYVDYMSLKVFYSVGSQFNTNEYSYLLKAQNFGFAIPSGSTINGIEVKVERKSSAGTIKDAVVKLIGADGTLTGNDKADTSTAWPISDTIKTYGSSSDMWGTSLTYSDINDADFGVAISVKSEATESSVFVDYITIAVTWTEAGSSAIKTVQGLAKASIKTIHGLAISSVKSLHGLQ